MAYFDRAQNRKDWEKMMVGLRAERERRASGEEPMATDRSMRVKSYTREPVSFNKLMEEYRAEQGIKLPSVSRSLERQSPQKSR